LQNLPPTPEEQIRFLVKLQRLLDEGLFVASYKFALLLALADLAIEKADDTGSPLTLTTDEIAEKFIQNYWRQVVPYPAASTAGILQQNTGKQAAVVSRAESRWLISCAKSRRIVYSPTLESPGTRRPVKSCYVQNSREVYCRA
jgi:hypothetical protein